MADNLGKFIVYRHVTASGSVEYHWRLRDAGGRTLASSRAGHREKADCEREMLLARESHPAASVLDLTAAT